MRQLLMIYFMGLLMGTLWPTKVSTIPFINISESLDFQIDLDSPVLAVEEDLQAFQEHPATIQTVQLPSLNESFRKPAPVVTPEVQHLRLADYSKSLSDLSSAVILKGPLELKQGLALTDDNRLEIHREEKGRVIEYGDVNIESGTYAIKLSSMEGHLCARLRGATQEILGQGCFSLDQIRNLNKSAKSGPLLSVSKYQDVVALSRQAPALSLASKEEVEPQPLPKEKLAKSTSAMKTAYQVFDYYDYSNSQVKNLPDVSVDNSVKGLEDVESTIVTYINSMGYVPTRIVSNQNTAKRGVPVQRNQTFKAAREIAQQAGFVSANDTSSGIIWGRAYRDGQPVAGADVSVEGRSDLRPLYLNELFIPDPNQKVTASHGIYTFVGVPEGEYALRAEQGSQFLGFQNASVRTGTMALADIDGTIRRKEVRLSLYDLVSKVSQPAVVTLQNFEEDIVVEDGHMDLQVQDTEDTIFALVNPLNKNYLSAQYALKPNEDLYNFPLIQKDWLESILVQARLKQAVKSKIVLGIGAQEPYKVTAVDSKSAQIVYFDANGQVIDGGFGQAGGGFLVIDPEDEVVEYAIHSASQKELRVHYMPSQTGVVSIIQMY